MPDKIDVLGVKFNNVKIGEAKAMVASFLEDGKKGRLIVTPNPEMVMIALDDPELAQVLNSADLSVADGTGVVLASHILGRPLVERVAGYDLMLELFGLAVENDYSVYLLGGKPGVVEEAGLKLSEKFPGLKRTGDHHGYLGPELEQQLINEIKNLAPDLLIVGMGVPVQEKFLARNLDRLNVGVAMTVGGAFDVLAGRSKRAPLWMQRLHLEWFYRLLQEPSRLGRMLALPRFVILVLKKWLKRRLGGQDRC